VTGDIEFSVFRLIAGVGVGVNVGVDVGLGWFLA
jgi:hypothetical protein